VTRDQIIEGLKAGRTLVVDRKDAPELAHLMELEADGLVTSELVQYDEQSSALKWRWALCDLCGHGKGTLQHDVGCPPRPVGRPVLPSGSLVPPAMGAIDP
jgi:hypothetical protein